MAVALGGIAGVSVITGMQPKAVSAALARGYFPAKTYFVMTKRLTAKGYRARAALWRQVGGGSAPAVRQAGGEARQ